MKPVKKPIITLLTDFGLTDPYVAEMKGVIISICPEAVIVDISHQIRKFDIKMGAFILASATPYFPEGSIHVAVVDPGVGTERRAIIIVGKRSIYVGPDNGLMILSALKEGIEKVYSIEKAELTRGASATFHGRDIFAKVAAYMANGLPPESFGPKIEDFIVPSFSKPIVEDGKVRGEIIHIDNFGNVITNIGLNNVKAISVEEGSELEVVVEGRPFRLKLCSTYGDVPRGRALTLIGSHGFLEIAVNQGSASEALSLKIGSKLEVYPHKKFR